MTEENEARGAKRPTLERTKRPGIFRRPGGTYAVTVRSRGKQVWRSARSWKEACALQDDLRGQVRRGIRVDNGSKTFGEVFEERMSAIQTAGARHLTLRGYRSAYRNHLAKSLGRVKIREIDRPMLRDLYANLKSDSMRRKAHMIVNATLRFAVEEGDLGSNPAAGIRLGRQGAVKEPRHLTEEQARRLLKVVRGHPYEGAVILGLQGGYRIAEVLTATWGDVDFETGAAIIRGSYWGATKNGQARRLILPPSAIAALRRVQASQTERLLAHGVQRSDDTPIVATDRGEGMSPQGLDKSFRTFCEAHGFDISFHGLRHTCALLMLVSGTDVRTAAERLGHRDGGGLLLRTYAHRIPSSDRAAAERLDAILGAGAG